MQKIKVLQIQNNTYDSTTSVGKAISQYVDANRFDITTLFLTGSLEHPSQNSFSLNLPDYALKGIGRWWAVLKLLAIIRKQNYQILIAHRFKPLHIALQVSKILGIPMIGVIHTIGEYDRPYRKSIIKNSVSEKTFFVAVSNYVKDYLFNLNTGFNELNTRTINNSIDFNTLVKRMYSREEAREYLGLDSNSIIFGSIGRLVSVKGHEQIIDAMAILKTRHPKVKTIIIGDGINKASLNKRIISLNINNHVLLPGQIDSAFRYLKAFDAFILPSHSEGSPLALLEAIAAKVPIIGSSIPPISNLVQDYGLIFSVGNSSDLAEKMELFLQKNDLDRSLLGEKLYEFIEENYNINKFSNSYNELISLSSRLTNL